jgi:hypothetical protein
MLSILNNLDLMNLILSFYLASVFVYFFYSRYVTFETEEDTDISNKAKNEFFEYLDAELEKEHINSIDDIRRIQRSVADDLNHASFSSRNLSSLLRMYLKDTISGEDYSEEKYSIVREKLEKLNSEEPFSDLPEKEETMAKSLKQNIESGKDGEIAIRQLKNLTDSLNTKYQTVRIEKEKSERWNKVGALAGIGGVVITVFQLISF